MVPQDPKGCSHRTISGRSTGRAIAGLFAPWAFVPLIKYYAFALILSFAVAEMLVVTGISGWYVVFLKPSKGLTLYPPFPRLSLFENPLSHCMLLFPCLVVILISFCSSVANLPVRTAPLLKKESVYIQMTAVTIVLDLGLYALFYWVPACVGVVYPDYIHDGLFGMVGSPLEYYVAFRKLLPLARHFSAGSYVFCLVSRSVVLAIVTLAMGLIIPRVCSSDRIPTLRVSAVAAAVAVVVPIWASVFLTAVLYLPKSLHFLGWFCVSVVMIAFVGLLHLNIANESKKTKSDVAAP